MKKSTKIVIGLLIFLVLWRADLLDDAILGIIAIVFGAYFLFCILAGLLAGITASFGKDNRRPSTTCMRGVDKSISGCLSMCDDCKWRSGNICMYF